MKYRLHVVVMGFSSDLFNLMHTQTSKRKDLIWFTLDNKLLNTYMVMRINPQVNKNKILSQHH